MNPSRVLVVEDEWIIAFLVQETLEMAGLEVVGIAGSEWDALDLAARTHPTHAVVDVKLEPGDGRNVARVLCRDGCCVVYTTAWASEVVHGENVPSGLCLAKPYNPEHLVLALAAARRLADGEVVDPLPPEAVRVRGTGALAHPG